MQLHGPWTYKPPTQWAAAQTQLSWKDAELGWTLIWSRNYGHELYSGPAKDTVGLLAKDKLDFLHGERD